MASAPLREPMKTNPWLRSISTRLTLILLLAWRVVTAAEPEPSSTPSGIWKWGWTTPSGQTIDLTLRVREDGTNFNGYVLGRNNAQSAIQNLRFQDGVLAFEAPRAIHGQTSMARYHGKLEGHKISGLMEFERDGEVRVRDWVATRNPDTMVSKRPGIAGLWRYKVKPADGDAIDLTVRFRMKEGKLIGSNTVFDNDVPVTDLEFKEGQVRFKVVREWDGKPYKSVYQGQARGDMIKGTIESDFGGTNRTYEWVAWRD